MSGDIRKTTRRRSPFEKGSTGVYCWRKGFENQGPVLWYLVETQKVDADVFGVDDQASQPEVWLSWVNALRREYGVAAVTLEPSDWMEPLFHPGRLYHDHQSLVALDAHLRKQFHLRMIGENRVAGKSLSSLMKQMWSSPRHRKLLIAPQAQKMAIKQQSGFAVLMMLKEAF